jgi:hypothetical protein
MKKIKARFQFSFHRPASVERLAGDGSGISRRALWRGWRGRSGLGAACGVMSMRGAGSGVDLRAMLQMAVRAA